jgi:hypothetical protein
MAFKKGENSRKLRGASEDVANEETLEKTDVADDVVNTEYLPSADAKEVVTSEKSVGKSAAKVYVWDTNVGFGRGGRNFFFKRGDVVRDLTSEEFDAFLVKKSIKEKI